ncbi:DNA repair protein RadC [Jannaschia sp. Os4]|uniref:RadC family protein n=1 Tax=Jannaschia sp. Os4 TaxID=2807617 RepID=UPI001EEDBEBE|nr:DNA repair protein RadC [Jannaschia sp. Os4]
MVVDADGRRRPHYHGHRARLRERFLSGGADALPDYELLELLLFDAIPRVDVKPLAKRLLARFGDLSAVVAAPDAQILQVDGATDRVVLRLRMIDSFARRIGRAKIADKTLLSSWDDLVGYCRTAMAFRQTEAFRVLFLDRKNALLGDEELAQGTVGHVPVYPREVARRALELNASAIILVHNHPSGDPTPSTEDVEMTEAIVRACGALEIVVHDHIVIGAQGEASLRSLGLMG